MTRNTMRPTAALHHGFRLVPAVFAAAVLWLSAGTAEAARQVDEGLDAAADGLVKIEIVAGDVGVESWDRKEVHVTGTLGDGVERLRFERTRNRVEIEVIPKRGLGWGLPSHERHDAKLLVRVPQASALEIDAVSADIEIEGVGGDVEIDAVSGDIVIGAASSSLDVETVSGDIEIRGQKADVEAQSVSGDLDIRLDAGEVDAETVSGDGRLEVARLSEGKGETVSGDFEFIGDIVDGGRLELDSHSGRLEVSLPGDTKARIETDTHSGNVRRAVDGGDSDTRVELSTFSGDIRIRAR